MLTIFYGQTRIFFSMCRDGLVPGGGWLSKLSKSKVPVRIIVGFGVADRDHGRARSRCSELAELVNIGTLFAFLLVNIGVIVLRRTEPDMERPFRVPFVPRLPADRRGAVHLPDDQARRATTWLALRRSGWRSAC